MSATMIISNKNNCPVMGGCHSSSEYCQRTNEHGVGGVGEGMGSESLEVSELPSTL